MENAIKEFINYANILIIFFGIVWIYVKTKAYFENKKQKK
jgi:hypothetical protein